MMFLTVFVQTTYTDTITKPRPTHLAGAQMRFTQQNKECQYFDYFDFGAIWSLGPTIIATGGPGGRNLSWIRGAWGDQKCLPNASNGQGKQRPDASEYV